MHGRFRGPAESIFKNDRSPAARPALGPLLNLLLLSYSFPWTVVSPTMDMTVAARMGDHRSIAGRHKTRRASPPPPSPGGSELEGGGPAHPCQRSDV